MEGQLYPLKGLESECYSFAENYKVLDVYFPPVSGHTPKRKPKSQMICRFCGKRHPDVSFQNDPHIISEMFGRNHGLSDIECDDCNAKFAVFESDFANYLGLIHTFNKIEENKVPTYKYVNNSPVARAGNYLEGGWYLEISNLSVNNYNYNSDTGITEIHFLRKPHQPINIYKVLLKIAMNLIPEIYVKDYQVIFEFLNSNSHYDNIKQFADISITYLQASVSNPYCIIFEKRETAFALPSHVFQLYSKYSVYQIIIPFFKPDIKYVIDKEIDCSFCPPLFTIENIKSRFKHELVNFRSNDKVRNLKGTMFIANDLTDLENRCAYNPSTDQFLDTEFDYRKVNKLYIRVDSE